MSVYVVETPKKGVMKELVLWLNLPEKSRNLTHGGGGGGCARRGRKVIQKKGKRRVIRYGGKKRWALLRELDLKSTELRTETACKVTV